MASRVHVRFIGTMGSPAVETWSVGVNFGTVGGAGAGDTAIIQNLATTVADYVDTTTALQPLFDEMSTAVTMTNVEVYGYQTEGAADAAGAAPLPAPKQGSGTIKSPFQIARCVSLQTSQPGASRRGRFYVPAMGASPAITGKVPPPAGYLLAWKTLFNQIEASWTGSAPIELGVYSKTLALVTPVTSMRVGDVLDTQRRRRDALTETYSSIAY